MGKTHVDHRLVLINAMGRTIRDQHYDSFAIAMLDYERQSSKVCDGEVLTVQHGARIICSTANDEEAER